jgi:hypothetical protein
VLRAAFALAEKHSQQIVCSVTLLMAEARVRDEGGEGKERSNDLLGGGAKIKLLRIEFDVEVVAAGGNFLSELIALLARILNQ